ncbi:alpha-mannosidase [Paenibacillus cremeus]|uniref:Alpha-mannosidase n=2 Tax=Paenibacillus cremeus TaxID=2163881 RepID=A0A559KGJ1_9BACL|nr:alpha-mannosidase [Paenibacillus cremeus]
MHLAEKKLEKRIAELEPYRYIDLRPIPSYQFWIDQEAAVGAKPPETAEWRTISLGERWSGWDLTAWLKTEVTIPAEWKGKKALGLFDFGKTGAGHNSGFESLIFLNGEPFQGVGTNHPEVFLPERLIGQTVELLFKVWTGLNGMTGDKSELEHQLRVSALALLEEETDDLIYTASAVLQTIQVLGENSWEQKSLLRALDLAFQLIDWRVPGNAAFYASVKEANAKLKQELAIIPQNSEVTVRCIGHTHIDVAWLWRLKHTREKSARSFSTVLRFMEQFPEYTFLQTQPQLYDYLEKDYPELYSQIAERIREGRWEAGGAMWLESDCNVPSGESLVRQLLYGMRYFEQRFGARCEYLWLPDVFGYSWALPQILLKAGLRYFMTTKISWNVYNRFPHDTFYWQGIDGSQILTHYITTTAPDAEPGTTFYTYNGLVLPETVTSVWDNYQDKELNRHLLLSFGYGDGGGGPTRTMLEMRRRMETMPGLPKVTIGRADEYFNQLEETVTNTDRYVHKWDGELYLELHRGTYTSQAYNKKMNRRMEQLLHDAEMVSTFFGSLAGFAHYPGSQLYDSWKIVLRNQFHDILPGSSIAEVYADSRIEYAEAEALASGAKLGSLQGLARLVSSGGTSPGWIVMNTLPWERKDLIRLPWEDRFAGQVWYDAKGRMLPTQRAEDADRGSVLLIEVNRIPAFGYTTIQYRTTAETADQPGPSSNGITASSRSANTPFYDIEWNDEGQLTRLFDKRMNREVLASGEKGNRFDIHEDKPLANDAWDIDLFYYEKVRHVTSLTSVEVVEQGELRTVIRFAWTYEQSELIQDMVLYPDDPRIDFVTRVHWQERQQLLKVAFPVNVRATKATYEIQFGNVERPTHWNTSWDFARFETCAHRWVDLSERGFGVSLLNDCKYGHDVRDNVLRLTLIKSAVNPDPTADLGEHIFTYSLLPHDGDWFKAGTAIEAHKLNSPASASELPMPATSSDSKASLPASLSFFACDSTHVVVDTIKKAEDSDEWIVRCYEYAGQRGSAGFTSHFPMAKVEEVNLMEREEQVMAHTDRGFEAYFKPYELKTFRIRFMQE